MLLQTLCITNVVVYTKDGINYFWWLTPRYNPFNMPYLKMKPSRLNAPPSMATPMVIFCLSVYVSSVCHTLWCDLCQTAAQYSHRPIIELFFTAWRHRCKLVEPRERSAPWSYSNALVDINTYCIPMTPD